MSIVQDNITYIHNPEGVGSQLIIDALHSCYSHALIDCIFPYYWVLQELSYDVQIVVRPDLFIEFPHNLNMLNDSKDAYKGVYGELINLVTEKPVVFKTDHIFEHTYIYPKEHACERSIWNSRSVYPDRYMLTDTPKYDDTIISKKLDDFTEHVIKRLNISVTEEKNNKILIIDRLHDRRLHRSILKQLMYYGDCSIVYLEHMTFRAQVELFASNSIFVLAHGSAEINLLFAPRESIVFEFDTCHERAVIYKRLCDLRGLRHVVLPHNEDLDVQAKIFDILV